MPKRVLFITTSLIEGGAGKMVHHVAGLLSQEYSEVYAIAINKEKRIIRDNNVRYLQPLAKHDGGLMGFARTILAIRRVIKEVKPDIVVTFVSDVAVCTRIATLGIRHITIVSAERGDPFTMSKIWRVLTKWAYEHSDYNFFQLQDACDFYGEKVKKKSFVIPNAAFFNGEIGSHKSLNKTIVGAGRFVQEKGYDLLINAFKKVHDMHPEYSLIIYGEGPFRKLYEEQIEQLGLKEYVTMPGYTKDIANAIRNEDIFVLPSRLEGIPNVLIEAMLIGIPTVSCDCNPGGPRFLTDGGKYGIIVPMDDVDKLVDGIIRLIEDRELYHKFEVESPQIYEKLKPEVIELQWIEAFRQINTNNIQ